MIWNVKFPVCIHRRLMWRFHYRAVTERRKWTDIQTKEGGSDLDTPHFSGKSAALTQ